MHPSVDKNTRAQVCAHMRAKYQDKAFESSHLTSADHFMEMHSFVTQAHLRMRLMGYENKLRDASKGTFVLLREEFGPLKKPDTYKGMDKVTRELLQVNYDAAVKKGCADGFIQYTFGLLAKLGLCSRVEGDSNHYPQYLFIKEDELSKGVKEITCGNFDGNDDHYLHLYIDVSSQYKIGDMNATDDWREVDGPLTISKQSVYGASYDLEIGEILIGDEVVEYAEKNDLALPEL